MQTKTAFSFILTALLTSVFIIQHLTGTWNARNPFLNQFLHANVFHLALNCWILFSAVRPATLHLTPSVCTCLALGTIGMAAQPSAIGISAFIFAFIGLNWHIYDCRNNRIFISIALVAPAFLPRIAFFPHLIPFIAALLIDKAVSKWHLNQ